MVWVGGMGLPFSVQRRGPDRPGRQLALCYLCFQWTRMLLLTTAWAELSGAAVGAVLPLSFNGPDSVSVLPSIGVEELLLSPRDGTLSA